MKPMLVKIQMSRIIERMLERSLTNYSEIRSN
jgi:hypothetical protein